MYQTAQRNWAEKLGVDLPESEEHGAWSLSDHLLANVVDILNILVWQNANQFAELNQRSPKPKPMNRPGVSIEREEPVSHIPLAIMERMEAARQERNRIIEENKHSEDRPEIAGEVDPNDK